MNIYFYIFIIKYIYTPVSQQTYSCYCCSSVILDHTLLLGMTCPTLPLTGYILLLKYAYVQLSPKIELRRDVPLLQKRTI